MVPMAFARGGTLSRAARGTLWTTLALSAIYTYTLFAASDSVLG